MSPSWDTTSCAAIQELPSFLWNPKVQYCAHKSPPLVPILSQTNPVCTLLYYFFEIRLNTIMLSTFGSSYQNPLYTSLLPRECYMFCPSHPPLLHFFHLGPITPQHLVLKYPKFLLFHWQPSFKCIPNYMQNTVLYVLILWHIYSKQKQPLLSNGCVTPKNVVTVGSGVFCEVRIEAI
jgi:hypothetical protein